MPVTTDLSDAGLRTLVERNGDGMLVLDPGGTVLYANPAAADLLGEPADALRGTLFGLPPGQTEGDELDLRALHGPGQADRVVSLRTVRITWDGEEAVLATLHDVTDRTAAEQALREAHRTLAAVISAAPVAIIRLDSSGRVSSWNPAAEQIFGWTEAEVLGESSPVPITGPEHGVDPQPAEDLEVRRRDGSTIAVALSLARVCDDSGRLESVVGVATDVTERRLREQQVAHLASCDQLTGLLNRRSFEEALGRQVSRVQSGDHAEPALEGALLLIDLDKFKAVNDTAGHLAGDQMLIGVGRAISQVVRPGEVVARFGGDEFAVLVARTDADGARAAAERIRRQIAALELTIGGHRHQTTATVGGAVIDGSLDAAEVLAVADVALHTAKEISRDSVLIQEEAAGKAIELAQTARRAQSVRRALDAGLFVIEHQPLVSLTTGEPQSYEALIRLPEHETLNLPATFLPLADSMGLMWEIDRWMTELAVQALSDPGHPPVWVNLWRSSLGHPAILDVVRGAGRTTIEGRLGFEVPEQARAHDLVRAEGWMADLRGLGARFALDDFGTHSTTFSLLREFPIDLVKIDRQYVLRLAEDPIDQQMVRAIVDFCHGLGMTVAVEGVEDEATWKTAQRLGVDLGQGFLWSRTPVAPTE
jgi:diguanylate cyclase (GGDEF)-like protein/PAS domain S-box-containing protein